MIQWIEATGKTEEAAVASALKQLGKERDDVSVELLERAKNGFFGIGACLAKVRVSYEVPDEAPKETQKNIETPQVKKRKEEPAVSIMEEQKAEPAEDKNSDVESRILEFLTGLFDQMKISPATHIAKRPEGGYSVKLEGEKLGVLIGHRGETLDAVQQLTNYAVNRTRARRVRIHIDVENYRQKRDESLQRLANKVAGKVIKYHRNITLEPMNAYERHVIHETLQEYPNVITYSTGVEPHRRTVVAFSKGKHSY